MNEYWVVTEYRTGRVIAHCGAERDALMLCEMRPTERTYRKQKFIVDQVIDITSTIDKELPGQQGLPAAKIKLEDAKLELQLREGNEEVFIS